MVVMKVIIVEDEKIAAEHLKKSLEQLHRGIEVSEILTSWQDTANRLSIQPLPDLIFMDIHLADGSAFEIFKKVKVTVPIIFITAYDQYVMESLRLTTIDYLLKPFQLSDLNAVISKYENLSDHFKKSQAVAPVANSRSRILVKQGNNFLTLQTTQVAFFFCDQKVVFAIDVNQKKYTTQYSSLSELSNELDNILFFKANRQFILNANYIDTVRNIEHGKLSVKLALDLEPIVISQDNAAAFKKWLNNEL
jgi:DNA-binding LytR/AlgR family response regulator